MFKILLLFSFLHGHTVYPPPYLLKGVLQREHNILFQTQLFSNVIATLSAAAEGERVETEWGTKHGNATNTFIVRCSGVCVKYVSSPCPVSASLDSKNKTMYSRNNKT